MKTMVIYSTSRSFSARFLSVLLLLALLLPTVASAGSGYVTAEELYALMSPARLQTQKVLFSSYVSAPEYLPDSDYCIKISGEEYWLKGTEMARFYQMVMGDEAKDHASGSSLVVDPEAAEIAKLLSSQIEHRLYDEDAEFWKVEFNEVQVAPFDGADSYDRVMVSVYLTWQANNSEERTKKMLNLFSDDLAATLANKNNDSDNFIADLWFFWTVPVYKTEGYFAKYHYQNFFHSMFLTEMLGPLYGKE